MSGDGGVVSVSSEVSAAADVDSVERIRTNFNLMNVISLGL